MTLGAVASYEQTCVVPDDPGMVVRGARPITEEDRAAIREQQIDALMRAYRLSGATRP